jgi:hypothetical protein
MEAGDRWDRANGCPGADEGGGRVVELAVDGRLHGEEITGKRM